MANPSGITVSRDQLSRFLPTPQLVRAFEDLIAQIQQVIPVVGDVDSTLILAQRALALAGYALLNARDEDISEPFPGQPGATGPQGRIGPALFLLEDSVQFEEQIRRPVNPIEVTGSRAAGIALTNLLAALAVRGIIIDSTTV